MSDRGEIGHQYLQRHTLHNNHSKYNNNFQLLTPPFGSALTKEDPKIESNSDEDIVSLKLIFAS